MSSVDDSSFISGISNISRISKASCSTLFKLDSTCNLSEWRSNCRDGNKSLNSEIQKGDSDKVSESTKVNKALSSCEDSTFEFAKLKLICDCLEEIANGTNKSIDKNTVKKLKKLLIIEKVKKYIHLPNVSKDMKEELTLLGIIDLPKIEFSYEEQLTIKSCLQAGLQEKIHSFLAVYENSTGSTSKDITKSNESLLRSRFQQKGELETLHWKDKIDEVCMEYMRDLQYCLKMFNRWEELKLKMNEKNTKDAENLLLQAEIAEMKVIITKLTCTLKMYKETPDTLNAFRIFNDSLDQKISSIEEEIAEKTELKKAYDVLSGTEYDEILRKYSELCHILKKKRSLLEKL